MLTEEQKRIVEQAKAQRASSITPITPDEKIKTIVQSTLSGTPTPSGFIADIKGIGTNIAESFKARQEKGQAIAESNVGAGQKAFQALGQGAGFLSDVVGSTVVGGVKALTPEFIQKPVGEAVKTGVEAVAQTEPVQKVIQRYQALDDNTKRNIDALIGFGSLATDIAGAGLLKKPVQQAGKAVVETAKEVIPQIPRATQKLATIAKETVAPTITPEKAVGQIIQGQTKDIKSGLEALKNIDTKGVKTFKELETRINTKIPDLARQVDSDLSKDTTKTLLDNLTTTLPTKTGQGVSVNFVENALKHLDELYTTTGDVAKSADIKDLINTAKTQGLTKLEINDIARTYGQEFGSKAFSKIGEPLTSINARLYENTRSGLKDLARSGIAGTDAKAADKLMSQLYNTQNLIRKNVEAVNKLMQKIEERGLIEKIGHAVSKYTDVLTGGGLRGFIGGLLPRGAGYKTLNALDLEQLLERNLKIIEKASKAKTAKEFNSIFNKIFIKK